MNDFLINGSKPVTLYTNMLTFRDSSNKSFELDGDLLKTMTNYKFNATHSSPQDQKLNYRFGKEMIFNTKQMGRKSPRDESMVLILNSPAIMASGFSTIFFSSNPNKLCDKLKLLLQKNQLEIFLT